MDRDYSKIFFTIIIFIVFIIGFVGIKNYIHKREILKLLQEQPIEYVNIASKLEKGNINLSDNNNYYYDSTSIYHNSKKIDNTSENITRKKQSGKDMISDIYTINENDTTYINNASNIYANSDDIELLARLINSEAGDEPYLGKIAVGNVVLYRTQEDHTSLKDTIFKKNQFDGVNTNNFNIQPNEDSIKAAIEVLNGETAIADGYYFVNLNMASPSWAKTDTFITRIGDHWFFRKE